MPIKIPRDLPARQVLEDEGVLLIGEDDAIRQDIRPIRVALLNLMPEKIKTENQIARVLGSTPLQVELTLLTPGSHTSKNTPQSHLRDFYRNWDTIRDEKFDGFIVTGAPIEKLPFEEVTYWDELKQIFDWSRTNVHSLFSLCWGAQAALYHFHGIPKYTLPEKRFGVYWHKVKDHRSLLMRGMNDQIPVPVSRHTENHAEDFANFSNLDIVVESDEAGPCLVRDRARRDVFMFNHLEYDSTTLGDEYARDAEKGEAINLPRNYFPGDDPAATPINFWRASAHLFYGNWLNSIYQSTPYDLEQIGKDKS
ncbi:homoserine O-succinyltransferase [Alphaproteobacteria bacterium HT1-32]|nr:homoserine O-succinyltransferase [Alphaproteobacteria bacterium HT1-32]